MLLLYNYALLKSLHSEGYDYMDAFCPFVLKIMISDKPANLARIQRQLENEFNLNIPIHVVKVILSKTENKNYIYRREDQYYLSEQGKEYTNRLETEKEVIRRSNALIEDIKNYFHEKEFEKNLKELIDLIESFIQNNFHNLVIFFDPSHQGDFIQTKPTKEDILIIDYIIEAEKSKPDHYKTIQDIIFGSIIASILQIKKPADLNRLEKNKFKNCQIYLDTNFIFSLLELHEPEFNKSAIELYNILKKENFKLRIFDFTIDEITRVVTGYINLGHRYPKNIKVDSIYGHLRRIGWNSFNAREFIVNLEDRLTRLGIIIEITSIDLRAYEPKSENDRKMMERYKFGQDKFHQNHDLLSLQLIKDKRKSKIRKIEKCKCIFLTSDGRLFHFNFQEMNHKRNGTICEAIFDRLFTTILWLKNPNLNISLRSIIGIYSRDLFVRKRVWEKFYEVLAELKEEGKITDNHITTLLYHNYIEDSLRKLDDNEIDLITPEFIWDKIEEATHKIEKDIEKEVRKTEIRKKEEYLEIISKDKEEIKKEQTKKWLNKLDKIKMNIKQNSEKNASRIVKTIRIGLFIPCIIIIIVIILKSYSDGSFNFISGSCTIIFSLLAIFGFSSQNFWRGLEIRIQRRLYLSGTKSIGLDETES